jgi:branched-chain amino acid aminotransferase
MIAWLNGAFEEKSALIDIGDRGLLLGDGVFETIYVETGRCAFCPEHVQRLRAGLGTLRIAEPAALGDISGIIAELAAKNRLAKGSAAARVTVTRGPGARGLKFGGENPTMIVTVTPLGAFTTAPLRLFLSARPRFAGASTAGFKSIGGYTENFLAHNEAIEAGADEALMLNEQGRLAAAAAANVFLIRERRIMTPSIAEGALPGVVRNALLAGAAEAGVEIEECLIEASELRAAQVFLTNSLIGLRPATFEGGPSPARRKIFRALQTWYQQRLKQELAGDGR